MTPPPPSRIAAAQFGRFGGLGTLASEMRDSKKDSPAAGQYSWEQGGRGSGWGTATAVGAKHAGCTDTEAVAVNPKLAFTPDNENIEVEGV